MCVLTFLIQAGVLDYYLIAFLHPMWSLWVIVDLICLALFIVSLVMSSNRFFKHRRAAKCEDAHVIGFGELPLGYIAWAIYSLQLSLRTVIIYKYIIYHLEEKYYFGPNTLRTAMALTAVIFLELVLSHQDAPRKRCIHDYINDVAGSTALDILDAVAILDALYDPNAQESQDPVMHSVIVTISSINFMLPTLPLFVLSRGHFDEKRSNVAVYMSYRLLHTICGDFALLIIRMILWHVKEEKISVFLIKNCINIGMTIKEVYELFVAGEDEDSDAESGRDDREEKKSMNGDDFDKPNGMSMELVDFHKNVKVKGAEETDDCNCVNEKEEIDKHSQNSVDGVRAKYRVSTLGFDAAHA